MLKSISTVLIAALMSQNVAFASTPSAAETMIRSWASAQANLEGKELAQARQQIMETYLAEASANPAEAQAELEAALQRRGYTAGQIAAARDAGQRVAAIQMDASISDEKKAELIRNELTMTAATGSLMSDCVFLGILTAASFGIAVWAIVSAVKSDNLLKKGAWWLVGLGGIGSGLTWLVFMGMVDAGDGCW